MYFFMRYSFIQVQKSIQILVMEEIKSLYRIRFLIILTVDLSTLTGAEMLKPSNKSLFFDSNTGLINSTVAERLQSSNISLPTSFHYEQGTNVTLDDKTQHPAITKVCITIYCLIMIGGILGNLTTVLSIFKDKQFWRHTYYCIASTAVSDILVCLLLPLNIIHLATDQQTLPNLMCYIEAYSSYWFLYTSALTICFTGFCRYIQVVHYDKIQTFRKCWILTVCLIYAWVTPLLVLIPSFISKNKKVLYQPLVYTCQINKLDSQEVRTFSLVFISVPMLVLTVYFYIHIYIFVWRSKRKVDIHVHTISNPDTEKASSLNEGSGISNAHTSVRQGKQTYSDANLRKTSNLTVPDSLNRRVVCQGESSILTTNREAPTRRRSLQSIPSWTKQEKKLTLSILVTSIVYIIGWSLLGILQLVIHSTHISRQVELLPIMVTRMFPLINVITTYTMNSRLRGAAAKMLKLSRFA